MADLTNSAMAEAIGVAPSLVSRYRSRGMPMDSAAAAQAWMKKHVRARAKPGTARGNGKQNAYLVARTSRERSDAEMAAIAVLERRGQLVSRDKVRAELTRRLAGVREGLLQMPARMQSLLAAEQDEAKVHDLLQDEIYAVLGRFDEAL